MAGEFGEPFTLAFGFLVEGIKGTSVLVEEILVEGMFFAEVVQDEAVGGDVGFIAFGGLFEVVKDVDDVTKGVAMVEVMFLVCLDQFFGGKGDELRMFGHGMYLQGNKGVHTHLDRGWQKTEHLSAHDE